MVFEAFDKADEYRMPAMILADGMLGQMMEPVEFPELKSPIQWKSPGRPMAIRTRENTISSIPCILQPQQLEQTRSESALNDMQSFRRRKPEAEEYLTEDADIVVVAYGASARIARSAVNAARAEGH